MEQCSEPSTDFSKRYEHADTHRDCKANQEVVENVHPVNIGKYDSECSSFEVTRSDDRSGET